MSFSAPRAENMRQATPSICTVVKPDFTAMPSGTIGRAGAFNERSARRPSWNTWNATLGA